MALAQDASGSTMWIAVDQRLILAAVHTTSGGRTTVIMAKMFPSDVSMSQLREWDWQAVDSRWKDVWRSTTTVNGEQSVMMASTQLMRQLLARVYLALGNFSLSVKGCMKAKRVCSLPTSQGTYSRQRPALKRTYVKIKYYLTLFIQNNMLLTAKFVIFVFCVFQR